jgi:hypothetical protein
LGICLKRPHFFVIPLAALQTREDAATIAVYPNIRKLGLLMDEPELNSVMNRQPQFKEAPLSVTF